MVKSKSVRIGIIGGSIAGCAAAIELFRLGFDVSIYEKSEKSTILHDDGIVFSHDLLKTCIERDLFDKDIPRLDIDCRTFCIKDKFNEPMGKTIWCEPFEHNTLNWAVIFDNLRKRIPDEIYHADVAVNSIREVGNKVKLELSDKTIEEFDYLIAADGYHSLARKLVFPDVQTSFPGYVCWKGQLTDDAVIDETPFLNHVPYYCFENGYAVFYFIPQQNRKGQVLNWLFYQDQREMAGKGKHFEKSTLVVESTADNIDYLHRVARKKLPSYLADLVFKTKTPLFQIIFEMLVVSYHHKRILLLGNSGAIIRPHIGSGTTSALLGAITMARHLRDENDLLKAFDQWDREQILNCKKQAELAKAIGDAMILNAPNWNEMDQVLTQQWWMDRVVKKGWPVSDSVTQH